MREQGCDPAAALAVPLEHLQTLALRALVGATRVRAGGQAGGTAGGAGTGE